ncbi:hypothetical protein T10_10092 [Trichinella papuae]|uniref:Uncharacterized protein n=1 Tax=Trichinella papuae TaxID=268474 RepID=A0A0V1N459_9BILA|nr:hypothetical protein T10_10092 [Trichinella papuae]
MRENSEVIIGRSVEISDTDRRLQCIQMKDDSNQEMEENCSFEYTCAVRVKETQLQRRQRVLRTNRDAFDTI